MDVQFLDSKYNGSIKVRPRWPYTCVAVAPEALRRLEEAQSRLGAEAVLVLTRGYEPGGVMLRCLHSVCRVVASRLFRLLYPSRANQASEIFSPNGHDTDGTHVDVAVEIEGKVRKLLPLGVFSTSHQIATIVKREEALLRRIYGELNSVGFRVHVNPTEALQIHCDMMW